MTQSKNPLIGIDKMIKIIPDALISWLKFNSSRYRLYEANSEFAHQAPSGSYVLDAGAGDAPYKILFSHTNYESADFHEVDKNYAKSTYVCDLSSIPTEDNRFDFIIFNQVLEHIPEPMLVLKELSRVLKPGGHMLYTGPLFYEEHEQPYDFYRYTQYGLQHMFKKVGFSVLKLEWLEGYFGTIAYQLSGMARDLPIKPTLLGGGVLGYLLSPFILVLRSVFAFLSVLFHRLEVRMKITQTGYPKNYLAIVSNNL